MSKKTVNYRKINRKKVKNFSKNNKKRRKKSTKKRRKARGKEDEVPFILKKRLEQQGIYEPGIISKMLQDVTRNTVRAAITRKNLKDSYSNYIREKRKQKFSMQEKFEKNKKRIDEINKLLKDPKIMQTDGPSRSTRSKSKIESSNKYKQLISEKEKLVNENDSISYILSRRY